MFTGLVQSKGIMLRSEPLAQASRWRIRSELAQRIKGGDSVSVNGVCLTALEPTPSEFSVEISPETLQRSSFSHLKPNQSLNLELPATPQSFLGGHWVQGHVDGVGEILQVEKLGDFHSIVIQLPKALMIWMPPKGSVCVDGVSLTVNETESEKNQISLMIIPQTWHSTIFSGYSIGTRVNIEADSFVKSIHHFWTEHLRTQPNLGSRP